MEVAHETHESLSNDSLIKTTIIYCALKMQHGLGQHSILEKVSKYVDLDIYQTFLQGIFVLWSATSCVKNEGRYISATDWCFNTTLDPASDTSSGRIDTSHEDQRILNGFCS